jgi:hypothetical protein
MNNKELEELKGRIEDYREIIYYTEDLSDKLGIDELLLLLAECIGDKKIEEEVGQYVDDYNKSWEQTHQEFIDLHKAIGELVNWYNKNTTQEL